MKLTRTVFPSHLLLITCALAATVASARENPVDPVSNPHHLNYPVVQASLPDFDEPFLRDGIVSRPAAFARISAGLPVEQVVAQLGQPLREGTGARGPEWDYNFKLLLPESKNYMVCQYKVVFEDGQKVVREAVWRRKQCLDLVTQAVAAQ